MKYLKYLPVLLILLVFGEGSFLDATQEDLQNGWYLAHSLLLITIFVWVFWDYAKLIDINLAGYQVLIFFLITMQAFIFFQVVVDVKFLIPDNLAKIIHFKEVVKLSLFLVLYLVGSNLYKSYLINNLEKIS